MLLFNLLGPTVTLHQSGFVINDTIANVNAILAQMIFIPVLNSNGIKGVDIRCEDNGNIGAGNL